MSGLMDDPIVERTACPACGALVGQKCYTPISGVDTQWTHDARVYADMGVRGVRHRTPSP